MTLDTIANLSQIIGVFGLIASLIYVGRQVQQSSLQMQVGASSERLGIFVSFWMKLAESREFTQIVQNGESDFSGLDEIDRRRLLSFETAGLAVWHHFFELHEQGLLSESVWKAQLLDMEIVGRRQAMKEAWAMNKPRFDDRFKTFLAKYVE